MTLEDLPISAALWFEWLMPARGARELLFPKIKFPLAFLAGRRIWGARQLRKHILVLRPLKGNSPKELLRMSLELSWVWRSPQKSHLLFPKDLPSGQLSVWQKEGSRNYCPLYVMPNGLGRTTAYNTLKNTKWQVATTSRQNLIHAPCVAQMTSVIRCAPGGKHTKIIFLIQFLWDSVLYSIPGPNWVTFKSYML